MTSPGVMPTKRQVEEYLKYQIVRRRIGLNPTESTIHAIRCLEAALLMVREWKPATRSENEPKS